MNLKHLIAVLSFLPVGLMAQQVWSLEKCIQHARDNNIQIKQSELQADLAKRMSLQQKAEFLPSVNGQANNTYNFGRTIDPFTNQFADSRVRSTQLFLSGNVTLFNGFQNWNSATQAHYDYLASTKDTEKMRNDVSLNIATAYLQILFGKELLKNAENQLEISKLQRDRINKLVTAGQSAESNFFDIEAQVSRDELQKVNAENSLNLFYLQLFQYLQLDINTEIEIEIPNFAAVDAGLLNATADAVYSTALQNMPDIKAQEYRLKSAEKARLVAFGGISPRITMNASYGSGYSGNNKIGVGDPKITLDPVPLVDANGQNLNIYSFNQSYDSYEAKPFNDQLKDNLNKSIGITLTIPLFNNLSTNTAIKRANINNMNQKLQLDATKNALQQTVQRSYNDAMAALKQYQASEKLVRAQQESFKYAEIKYQQNLINSVDYTDAKIKLSNAQNDLIRSKYDYIFKTKVLDFYQGKSLTFN